MIRLVPVLVCLLATGCAMIGEPPRAQQNPIFNWQELLAENPMPADQNIQRLQLGSDGVSSHHLVRVRDREPYHIHARHDLEVYVLEGTGVLIMNGRQIPCSKGHVVNIPAGVKHQYINLGDEPAVAHAIFTPPFDGKDTIPVE